MAWYCLTVSFQCKSTLTNSLVPAAQETSEEEGGNIRGSEWKNKVEAVLIKQI